MQWPRTIPMFSESHLNCAYKFVSIPRPCKAELDVRSCSTNESYSQSLDWNCDTINLKVSSARHPSMRLHEAALNTFHNTALNMQLQKHCVSRPQWTNRNIRKTQLFTIPSITTKSASSAAYASSDEMWDKSRTWINTFSLSWKCKWTT